MLFATPRRFLMRLLCTVFLLLPICFGACTNVHRTTKEYKALAFQDFLLVAPSDWTDRDTVRKFIEHKERSGFQVTVVPINVQLGAQERFDQVRSALRQHIPQERSAVAALILGDFQLIPAGPWQLEGVQERIYSDVPVAITQDNAPALDDEVQWQDLEGHFDQMPAHLIGRIPYADPTLVDTVLVSSMRYENGARARKVSAVFAAPRWGPPFAIGVIIDGAHDAMVDFGWDSEVYGVDGTPDFPLHTSDYLLLSHEENGRGETFIACGGLFTLVLSASEPVRQLPEDGQGLTWSFETTQGKTEQDQVSVSCFALFPENFNFSTSSMKSEIASEGPLRDFVLGVTAPVLFKAQQILGPVELDSLVFRTAGITIVRSHMSNERTCTCGTHWGNGRCSSCGVSFSSIREKIQLDTQDKFSQRNFDKASHTEYVMVQDGITDVWVEQSPDLVYTVGHGGRVLSGWESTLQTVVSTPSIAVASLKSATQEESFTFKVGKELQPISPANPAVLFATGCAVAAPGDPLLRELFTDRWIAAYLGATTTVGPYPILPATDAESNIARYLGGGLPLGLAGHATRAGYLNDARIDPTLYFVPGMIEGMRTNLASYILYGDPTLKLPTTDQEDR